MQIQKNLQKLKELAVSSGRSYGEDGRVVNNNELNGSFRLLREAGNADNWSALFPNTSVEQFSSPILGGAVTLTNGLLEDGSSMGLMLLDLDEPLDITNYLNGGLRAIIASPSPANITTIEISLVSELVIGENVQLATWEGEFEFNFDNPTLDGADVAVATGYARFNDFNRFTINEGLTLDLTKITKIAVSVVADLANLETTVSGLSLFANNRHGKRQG